mgnify:FL=1
MATTRKKMAAALAAVNAYLQEEEQAAAQQKAVTETFSRAPSQTLWSQSGKLEMMNLRRLIQIRAFGRFR